MKKKVLVLDDEELLTRTFVKLLERNNYEVMVTSKGDDALIMVEEEAFDLIISDIRIPGKDGVAVVTEIFHYLNEHSRKRIPVIFITGFADDESEKKAKALNPVAYLSKPFDVKELLDIISGALS